MIKSIIVAVLLSVALFVSSAVPNPPKAKYDMDDVFVYNNKIMVEGKEFYIKGFNYSPQPLGMEGILAVDGAGICSQKKNNEGVPQSACFLEDYFDGMVHPDFPDHGPWFQQVWDRDFALMKDMGVNAVRIYHMHYITKSLLTKYPDMYQKYKMEYASDHVPFFDAAQKYGIKVICPVTDTETVLTTTPIDELKRYVEARVDEVGNHPALLMWAVGNELGLYMKPALRAIVNELMDYLREYTLKKWNRIIPVTTVEVDLPRSYIKLMNEMRVDVFTSNCGYRDVFINSAWDWDTNPDNNMPGWAKISEYYGVPLLVGEYGMHEQDKETAARPDWINQQIRSMVVNKENGGVGYLFFEWNEEHLKPPNQQDMGIIRFSRNLADGKDSMKKGDLLADTANPKDVIYQAAKEGLPDSPDKQWNYGADVYQLTDTTQVTVDLNTIPVRPFPTRITTPPTIPDFTPLPDEDPEMICFGISSKDPNSCNGHGTCIATNFCSCNSGYSGDQCTVVRKCYGKNFDDDTVCNSHGTCTDRDSCSCRLGYSGNQCQNSRTCKGISFDSQLVCSRHGTCTDQDECTCTRGYLGDNCERRDPTVPDSSIPEESPIGRQSEDVNSSNSFSIILLTLAVIMLATPAYMWLY